MDINNLKTKLDTFRSRYKSDKTFRKKAIIIAIAVFALVGINTMPSEDGQQQPTPVASVQTQQASSPVTTQQPIAPTAPGAVAVQSNGPTTQYTYVQQGTVNQVYKMDLKDRLKNLGRGWLHLAAFVAMGVGALMLLGPSKVKGAAFIALGIAIIAFV